MGTAARTRVIGAFALMAALIACAGPDRATRPQVQAARAQTAAALQNGPRHAVSYLYLGDEGLAAGLPETARDFLFQGRGAGRISVLMTATGQSRLMLQAQCDGPVRFVHDRPEYRRRAPPAWTLPGSSALAELPPGERLRSQMELDPATTACRLQVTPAGHPAYELRLQREEHARPGLAAADSPPGTCPRIRPPAGDALAAVFHARRGLSLSCPTAPGPIRLLEEGTEALNAKIEALTGARLSAAALRSGDPGVVLDFANAPRLDLIYVSYLNVNADFTGFLMARMLAFHAARGTVVRVLVPDIMLTGTERALFQGLAARYPTVQLQPYRVPPDVGPGVENHLGRLHRVSHVKLFATVSRDPGRSVAIIGGRNLHDGYVFARPLDLRRWPFLHQYNPSAMRIAGGFASYEDFEIALSGEAQVRSIVAHMSAYWQRDHDSQRLLPGSPGDTGPGPAPGSRQMRHFLSVPYADDQAQEALFVDLIDAARSRIDIASPYMNLTPALEAAFLRARARGVDVGIVTTIRVREATEFLVTGLNQTFANQHADWMRLIDYDPYPRLLHSKILVFDRRLALVTSTNLNRRSFLHDTENGVMILDPVLAERIARVVDGYAEAGTPVQPGLRVNRLVTLMMRWRLLLRAF